MTNAALLIAASSYDDTGLQPLPSCLHDVDALHRALSSPTTGIFTSGEVEVLPNPKTKADIERAVASLTGNRQPDDLVLFYYSGHGMKASDGGLYLAATTTKKEEPLLSGFDCDFLKKCLRPCRAERVVVILDCCYSGEYIRIDAKGEEDIENCLRELAQWAGRVVITSSNSIESSIAKIEGHTLSLSLFTHCLIKAIESGCGGQLSSAYIPIREAFEYAVKETKRISSKAPEPRICFDLRRGTDVPIALNPQRRSETRSKAGFAAQVALGLAWEAEQAHKILSNKVASSRLMFGSYLIEKSISSPTEIKNAANAYLSGSSETAVAEQLLESIEVSHITFIQLFEHDLIDCVEPLVELIRECEERAVGQSDCPIRTVVEGPKDSLTDELLDAFSKRGIKAKEVHSVRRAHNVFAVLPIKRMVELGTHTRAETKVSLHRVSVQSIFWHICEAATRRIPVNSSNNSERLQEMMDAFLAAAEASAASGAALATRETGSGLRQLSLAPEPKTIVPTPEILKEFEGCSREFLERLERLMKEKAGTQLAKAFRREMKITFDSLADRFKELRDTVAEWNEGLDSVGSRRGRRLRLEEAFCNMFSEIPERRREAEVELMRLASEEEGDPEPSFRLSYLYRFTGQWQEAYQWTEECIKRLRQCDLPRDHWIHASARRIYGYILWKLSQTKDLEPERSCELLRRAFYTTAESLRRPQGSEMGLEAPGELDARLRGLNNALYYGIELNTKCRGVRAAGFAAPDAKALAELLSEMEEVLAESKIEEDLYWLDTRMRAHCWLGHTGSGEDADRHRAAAYDLAKTAVRRVEVEKCGCDGGGHGIWPDPLYYKAVRQALEGLDADLRDIYDCALRVLYGSVPAPRADDARGGMAEQGFRSGG